MHNFCTLFDSHYFSRGVAMYESLARVCNDFHLYVFAFDDICLKALHLLKYPHMTVIPLADFEDDQLLQAKPERSIAEYCWTCTSSTILYVLEKYNVDQCTYLDADLFFFSSPSVIFEEMGSASILITEHRYTPRYDKAKKSGTYCVQFVSFKNDARGLKALRWWRDRCLEWCYARLEDGKFGDQLYLEDWTTRFEGVHVLQHPGGGLASWNIQQYDVFSIDNKMFIKEIKTGKEYPAVFYHFHYVRFFRNGFIELGRRELSPAVIDLLYKPYIHNLRELGFRLNKHFPDFDAHGMSDYKITWKTPLLFLHRKLTNGYHIYTLDSFLNK